jgi:D-tyrosyl-tRNA(Tyr) deacylase
MRALLQRVTGASVDGGEDVRYLADKILHLRIFADEQGRFQHSLLETGGACLLVAQFTLLANTRRGRRPDFLTAAAPEVAAPLIQDVAAQLRTGGVPVVEGRFGAHMVVRLANDGPVTILLDSRERG